MILYPIDTLTGMESRDEWFAPMEVCTIGKTLDDFLSKFNLDKVNKMVIKIQLDDDRKLRTLAEITDIEKVASFLSAINKVKCLNDFILCDCGTEIWLYESRKLRLKVALSVDDNFLLTRFYGPKQTPSIDSDLGRNDFLIVDEKVYSWLDKLIKEKLNIPMEN
jgi:hypothetical protein